MDTKYLTPDIEAKVGWANAMGQRKVPLTLAWFIKALVLCSFVGVVIFLVFDTRSSSAAPPPLPSASTSTSSTPRPTTTTTTPFVDLFARYRQRAPIANPPTPELCFRDLHVDYERVQLFPNVLTAERRPANGSNIFFHETTCLNGTARLNIRKACAIESAARTNPQAGIYVLYASPAGHERGLHVPELFAILRTYANVHFRTVDLWQYSRDTPAEAFMRTPQLFASDYPSVHVADFLRLVSLYRFGGTHIDLDFVLRKSFARQPRTFVGEEIGGFLSNAVMGFDNTGLGHVLATHVLTEFVEHFNGREFAVNGPALLKRVFHNLCQTEGPLFDCKLIKVEHKEKFYPVYGTVWEKLFDREHGKESLALMKDSLAVHMWNALSGGGVVRVGEHSAYEELAREFCPKVFATVRDGKF